MGSKEYQKRNENCNFNPANKDGQTIVERATRTETSLLIVPQIARITPKSLYFSWNYSHSNYNISLHLHLHLSYAYTGEIGGCAAAGALGVTTIFSGEFTIMSGSTAIVTSWPPTTEAFDDSRPAASLSIVPGIPADVSADNDGEIAVLSGSNVVVVVVFSPSSSSTCGREQRARDSLTQSAGLRSGAKER